MNVYLRVHILFLEEWHSFFANRGFSMPTFYIYIYIFIY